MALAHHEGASLSELASHSELDKGALSRVLKSLEQLGLIRQERDVADRRSFHHFLTDQGYGPFLAKQGYDVFVADLRGRGASRPWRHRYGFGRDKNRPKVQKGQISQRN